MSRRASWTAAGCFLAVVTGCGSAGVVPDSSAGRLDRGALALRQGDYGAAREVLASVRRACGDARLGRQALLLMATLEADPRNPAGDPHRAAALAGHWLTRPETFPWTRPMAETIYLQALRAGGRPYSASGEVPEGIEDLLAMDRPAEGAGEACEASDWQVLEAGSPPDAGVLPRPGGPTSPARGLREDNAHLRERLAELEAELQRIKETLRP